MSLDAFSVLVGFLAVVELGLGSLAMVLGIREARTPFGPAAELRRPLLALVSGTLVAVALVSCPLFYLLLASWVPRWPGIMCIEGVRRIGMGTVGAARWLPDLLSALDLTKLLVVFLAGAWVVLRRSPGTSAGLRAALVAIALGLVTSLDGAAAFAYVVLPKEEVRPAAGCCTAAAHEPARDAGLAPSNAADGPDRSPRTAAGFIAAAAVLGIGTGMVRRRGPWGRGRAAALALLAALAAASLPAAAGFLANVAAPALLDLPYHHCVWCAFASAPETLVGASLYLGAVLCAGWALVARMASAGGGDGGDPRRIRGLLGAASFGFLGTAAMSAAGMCCP